MFFLFWFLLSDSEEEPLCGGPVQLDFVSFMQNRSVWTSQAHPKKIHDYQLLCP